MKKLLLLLALMALFVPDCLGAWAPVWSRVSNTLGSNVARKTMTCAGATGDDVCDEDGANAASTLFTVTGVVQVRIIAYCTTLLASTGGGKIEVGFSGNTAALIAQTTATEIDANEIWHDATPDATTELDSVASWDIVTNGQDIIQTVSTDDIESGVIEYIVFWEPISSGASVVSA